MSSNSIKITMAGGETADIGDIVRTLVVDSTVYARVAKNKMMTVSKEDILG